jgi:DNA topoisomerase IA
MRKINRNMTMPFPETIEECHREMERMMQQIFQEREIWSEKFAKMHRDFKSVVEQNNQFRNKSND